MNSLFKTYFSLILLAFASGCSFGNDTKEILDIVDSWSTDSSTDKSTDSDTNASSDSTDTGNGSDSVTDTTSDTGSDTADTGSDTTPECTKDNDCTNEWCDTE
ncbi:MAG: hypothetical protein JXR91_15780, partial [Deltaproteobacteria bacterium]|nr:hypothetical protein [Deltaproteobacteria bacterium]